MLPRAWGATGRCARWGPRPCTRGAIAPTGTQPFGVLLVGQEVIVVTSRAGAPPLNRRGGPACQPTCGRTPMRHPRRAVGSGHAHPGSRSPGACQRAWRLPPGAMAPRSALITRDQRPIHADLAGAVRWRILSAFRAAHAQPMPPRPPACPCACVSAPHWRLPTSDAPPLTHAHVGRAARPMTLAAAPPACRRGADAQCARATAWQRPNVHPWHHWHDASARALANGAVSLGPRPHRDTRRPLSHCHEHPFQGQVTWHPWAGVP